MSDGDDIEIGDEPDGVATFDASKLLDGLKGGARAMGKDVIICRDLSAVQHMFENKNIMKGIKPLEDQQREEKKDNEPKIFRLPPELFQDFEELDHENEEMFEYVAYQVVIEYLERCCLCLDTNSEVQSEEQRYVNVKWDTALEFPQNLASMGRSKLHEVANYFGLAHHSRGRKDSGKKRNAVLYPKTLFLEKQEQERNRLLRERDRIRTRF